MDGGKLEQGPQGWRQFADFERVQVTIQIFDDKAREWFDAAGYTGTVMPRPESSANAHKPYRVNIMPDVDLPMGQPYATKAPRWHSREPFWEEVSDDTKVRARHVIASLAIGATPEKLAE